MVSDQHAQCWPRRAAPRLCQHRTCRRRQHQHLILINHAQNSLLLRIDGKTSAERLQRRHGVGRSGSGRLRRCTSQLQFLQLCVESSSLCCGTTRRILGGQSAQVHLRVVEGVRGSGGESGRQRECVEESVDQRHGLRRAKFERRQQMLARSLLRLLIVCTLVDDDVASRTALRRGKCRPMGSDKGQVVSASAALLFQRTVCSALRPQLFELSACTDLSSTG